MPRRHCLATARLFLLSLMSLMLFALPGCGGGESKVESGNRLGILHFGNGAEPQGLDPHIVSGIPEHHLIGALFEGLVQKDPLNLAIKPAAASTWTVSDDGRVYTFSLRGEASWSNGDPVTAHDFQWSWWRALQPGLANVYVFMLFPIKNAERYFKQEITDFSEVGVKAIDDHTLRVELANPTPYFLQLLDHYALYPVHRATIEKFGAADESYTQWTRPGNIVSNGPFFLDSWRLNKHVKVLRNENYWDAANVKLNGIYFYPIDQATSEERMFRAGQLHRTGDVPIDRIPHYRRHMPEQLHIEPYAGTYMYRFNTNVKPLDDLRVRKALAMSVDREQLINTVLNKLYTPAYAITPPGLLGYQPPQRFNYDVEAARKLLSAAGFPNGKDFPILELQYNSSEQHRKIAITIQQMWKQALNIDIRLQNKDWKVYLDEEVTGNFDISRGGWIADYVDPNTFLDMWTSESGVNRTGWKSQAFDKLILQDAPTATSEQERLQKFFAAETILMDNLPFVPIYTYASKHLRQTSVKGMPPNIMDHINFRTISLEPAINNATVQH